MPITASTPGTGSDSEDLTESFELIRRAQAGDHPSLNRLFERYYDRVRRIVRIRLGPALRSRLEVEDILQETFAAAVRDFQGFQVRDEGSFINWLAKLAEHKITEAADYFGAKKRDWKRETPMTFPSTSSSQDSVQTPSEPAASSDTPIERVSFKEQQERVEACVAGLPPDLREVIVLRDYIGLAWEQVAEQTGHPSAAAARMKHARALIELGRRLREGGHMEPFEHGPDM
jgi:RNA polymerase sigma-70 factor (ECF subfamily)